MKYTQLFILLSFIFSFIVSYAQHPKMLQYTIEDGIPGTEVFDVVQDDKGYIWLATNNGICKFNGKKFDSYYTRDGLPDNSVIEFYKDSHARIWILTFKNKLAYLINDSIYQYKYNHKLKDFERSSSYCITSFVVKNDNIYIGWLNKAIIKIDTLGNIDTIRYFSESSSIVYKIGGNEFVYSHYCPYKTNYITYVQEEDTSYYLKPVLKKNTTQSERIKYALYDKNLAASFGKHLFLIDKNNIQAHKTFNSDITKLKYDRNGSLWVCTYNNGIYCFPNSDINVESEFNLLKGKTITSFYQDNAGGYWISTMRNGVFYIPSLEFLVINSEDGLKEDFINNIAGGNNELWYTTGNNFVGYIKEKKIKQFDLSKINSFQISHIIYDNNENVLWGGFEGGTGSLFYADKNSFKSYKNEEIIQRPDYSPQNTILIINTLLQDHKTLIIGGSPHLEFCKKDKLDIFYNYWILLSVHTMDFGKTNNEIWTGNRDGLYFFKDNVVKYYGKERKLFKKRVVKLKYEKKYNQLWVATKDSGIYVLTNDTVRTITKNEGLSGNNITALCVKNNRIWVGTTEGLDQITVTDNDKFIYEIQHFNENKGLVSNIINDIEVIEPYVYIATNKGISFFNYQKVKKNITPPPVYITNIKINKKDTILKDEYVLSHDQNFIDIEYDGLGYQAPREISYKYKLEGMHKNMQTTSLNRLEFALLPPGHYNLIIYAVNEDGIWSKSPAEIRFIINPPFYETWWFISLIALTVVLITGTVFRIIYKVRLKEIRKRNRVEKELGRELIKERQKALGHQMNPHFIFNTLSSIQNYLYKKDRISSSIYLEKFSQLMRNTLYSSQNEFISLKDELKTLKTYMELEQLRFDEKFEFTVNTDENADIYLIKIPAFLIQPYIENSIWHGINKKKGKGLIIIDIKLKDDYIICSIEDNGIGREASAEINKKRHKSHISLGGKITEKRLKLINSLYNKNLTVSYFDLKDEKGNAYGTKAVLSIPVFYE